LGEFQWVEVLGAQNELTCCQQIFGTMDVDATAISSTDAVSAFPFGVVTDPGGSRYGLTELTGTIDERVSMDGDFTTAGEKGDQFTGTFSLTYDDSYERPSSLATL